MPSRKLFEQETGEHNEMLRQLMVAAPVAMLAVNKRGEIIFCNQKLEEMFGYSRAELVGQPVETLIPSTLHDVHRVHRAEYAALPHARQMGVGMDLEAQRKDGSTLDVEIGLNYLPVQDDILVLASIVDITLRKKTEELLEARVAERTAELEQLHAELEQQAVVAERSRIAHDLHDSVTQTLFSASIIADVLPTLWQRKPEEGVRRLNELRELTRGALAEMRTLLLELRPDALVRIELPELLRQLASAFIGRTRIPLTLTIAEECPLEQQVRLAIYRICQEALNNVAKHSDATQASIRVICLEDGVELAVEDNGIGFDPHCVGGNHLGLSIMQERANEIAATLTIQSQPGSGTSVNLQYRK